MSANILLHLLLTLKVYDTVKARLPCVHIAANFTGEGKDIHIVARRNAYIATLAIKKLVIMRALNQVLVLETALCLAVPFKVCNQSED